MLHSVSTMEQMKKSKLEISADNMAALARLKRMFERDKGVKLSLTMLANMAIRGGTSSIRSLTR